ncbi:transposase [Streptomyces sp. NPDC001292]|uniref:transposase n=1 Tax=Streptomyces sp. NPDC001292 TaxID=3364558 RepID=UPI00367A1FBD
MVVDDSGDRKDGTATAHVGKQYLGSVGKTDRGVVTVTTYWVDERVYYPVHARPYTPAHHFPRGENAPGFRTKPQIAADLASQAKAAGLVLRAVAADFPMSFLSFSSASAVLAPASRYSSASSGPICSRTLRGPWRARRRAPPPAGSICASRRPARPLALA